MIKSFIDFAKQQPGMDLNTDDPNFAANFAILGLIETRNKLLAIEERLDALEGIKNDNAE